MHAPTDPHWHTGKCQDRQKVGLLARMTTWLSSCARNSWLRPCSMPQVLDSDIGLTSRRWPQGVPGTGQEEEDGTEDEVQVGERMACIRRSGMSCSSPPPRPSPAASLSPFPLLSICSLGAGKKRSGEMSVPV